MTDWNVILGYLTPYTLRQIREDLREHIEMVPAGKDELEAAIADVTEMLVGLDGDEKP